MSATDLRPPRHAASRASGTDRLRIDIQGLRAIAVGLVVVYHLWPWHITGGYVGVDVFFVISGFLITSHMMREVDARGTLDLAGFWARRVRRLLPASLLVLGVALAATVAFVPSSLWSQFLREIGASALYVENWALAADAVDYLAAGNVPSPVQHYWSLSVEEQFYFVWPLLLLAAIALWRRRPRRAVAAALTLVTAASFGFSLLWTATHPAQAYFITPVRAWEFGAGALLALAPAVVGRERLRAVMAWIGIALIVAAALVLDESTPFPGIAALLPVAGTLLVIGAAADGAGGSPSSLLRWKPVQVIGELSYSIYLWHWVVIVIAPYALGRDLLALDKLVVLVLVTGLSWLTWRWVETPVRRSRLLLSRGPAASFLLAVAGMAVILGAGWAVQSTFERSVATNLARAHEVSEDPQVCFGAAAADPEGTCTEPAPEGLLPDPALVRLDNPTECLAVKGDPGVVECEFGVPADQATRTIALIGDSHAYHWLPGFELAAQERGWHGVVMARESCPFTPADRTLEASIVDTCHDANVAITERLAQMPDLDTVVMSAFADVRFAAPEGADERAFAVESYRSAIDDLPENVTGVLVIRDVPQPRRDVVECVEAAVDRDGTAAACDVPRDEALLQDALVEAAEASSRATVLDLTDAFCGDDACAATSAGAVIYANRGHVTQTFAQSAWSWLAREVDAASS